jgi:hypothetical protein
MAAARFIGMEAKKLTRRPTYPQSPRGERFFREQERRTGINGDDVLHKIERKLDLEHERPRM